MITAAVPPALAQTAEPDLSALTAAEKPIFLAYDKARGAFARTLDGYWATTVDKRKARRQKIGRGEAPTRDDYVWTQPPKYAGPAEPKTIVAKLPKKKSRPPARADIILPIADYVAAARDEYDFEPLRLSEAEFKRAYAAEALSLGFTADQIVRVFALETGGMGTHDMQSGIDPDTGRGKPISTAVGYAQLVDANSVGQVVEHGARFAARLRQRADAVSSAARRRALRLKGETLLAMRADAVTVPNSWSDHKAYALTPKGMALHALNLDGDVGPLMQVRKLRDTYDFARKRGRARLTGAELEMMNLAGPQSGLEMIEPAARDVPTANYFERKGYERNGVVRDRTAGELLAEIGRRMEQALGKPGAREFLAIFAEVERASAP